MSGRWAALLNESPLRVVLVAKLVTVLLFVVLGLSIVGVYRSFAVVAKDASEMHALVDRLNYLDEALTMSARMAAATGDPEWALRYQRLAPETDSIVALILGVGARLNEARAAGQLAAANQNMLTAEQRAIALVAEGNGAAALALLNSPEYIAQKQDFADAIARLSQALREDAATESAALRGYMVTAGVMTVAAALLSLLIGFFVRAVITGYMSSRNATEEALRRTTELLEALFGASPVPIVSVDAARRVTHWNPAAERLFGWTREEVLGAPLPIVPEGEHDEHGVLVERSMQGEGVQAVEVVRRRKDGSQVEVSLSSAPIRDASGSVIGVISVIQDITELKRAAEDLRVSEERYRLVGRVTQDAIWDWHIPSGQRMWGEGIQTVFGYTPDEVRPDLDWWSGRIHPDDLDALFASLDGAITSGGESWSGEYRFLRGDGSYADVFDRGLILRDEHGVAIRMIGSVADITSRKRAEAELVRAKEAAEAASQAKSDFLASMSHELRTPLNSVIGFSGVLRKNKDGNLRERDLGFLERIHSNGTHLLGLINNILDLSKVESGKVELEIAPVSLQDLVLQTLGELKGAVHGTRVELFAAVPEKLAPLETDAGKLKQVLINLVGNAIKFTHQGSVTVSVLAHPETSRPARIDVRDSGIGIPRGRLSAIFDAFEQAESGTARSYGGTGLGLAISRSLCKLMGYRLEVESTVGQGSTFSIVLSDEDSVPPARPEEEPGQAIGIPSAPAGREPELAEPPSSFAGKLVLVIDDATDTRLLLTHHLEELGCQTIAASSGDQGLRMAREFRPALITLDLLLPGMSGWEILRALKADPELRDIPVVIVSVVAGDDRANVLGAVDVLAKPFERDELIAVLQRHLKADAHGRVLIVDDEVDARDLLSTYLAQEELEIRTASNGKEALELLGSFLPDLIVLDLLMPEMDGIGLLKALHESEAYRQIPVVLVTAKELSREEVRSLSREAIAVLRKDPELEADLRAVIRQIYDGRLSGELAEATAADASDVGARGD